MRDTDAGRPCARLMHGVDEVLVAPRADARFRIGGDVGGVCAERQHEPGRPRTPCAARHGMQATQSAARVSIRARDCCRVVGAPASGGAVPGLGSPRFNQK